MEVKLIHVTVYDGGGWTWRSEDIRNPTWDDVETAIRRLDRFHYPFVGLFLSTDSEPYTYPNFNVIGGEGEFAMDSMADSAYYRYYEQTRGDEMIEIWRSDQGAAFEAKHCCPSLDTTLRATRYFCEQGTLDPDLPWQKQ